MGYSAYPGRSGRAGANSWITPSTSRIINAGNGFGATGNWWVSTTPVGANDVEWQGQRSRSPGASNHNLQP